MTSYREASMEELAAKRPGAMSTGPFGSSIGTATFRNSGVPVIRGGNLTSNIELRLIEDGFVFIDEDLALQFERSAVRYGDLIFTCWGTINQVGYINKNSRYEKYIISNKQMKFSSNDEIVDPLFIYYYFSSPIGQNLIISSGIGSSVPGFNLGQLKKMKIPLPDLSAQKAIVSMLSALDDKIELNRRMNETLEAMARAIFKDWFVDFGPTCAKIEGRAPYLAPEIWSLFPDQIDEEGRPQGWSERRLEEVMELSYGKALPATERADGPIPVYGSGGVTGRHSVALVDGPSIIVGRKGTVGALYWEDRPFFPIDTVFFVRPRAPLTFCYYLLQTLGLDGMNTDAAVPGLNRNNVYRLPVPWSSTLIRQRFDDLVSAFRRRIRANIDESQILAATRDLLLPKLMSGEIRVKDAERLAETASPEEIVDRLNHGQRRA